MARQSTTRIRIQPHPYHLSLEKRLFDLVVSTTLLVMLLPLLTGISICIFLSSSKPIFFHQRRLGKNKKPFVIHKFRVMYVNADQDQWRHRKQNQAPEPMYKNWQDPRYVGIGRWLSKTGLDELPQLVNILKGEMSLVGPRPLPVLEARRLNSVWDFRYQVKPGVFSVWSAYGGTTISLQKWRQLDRDMIQTSGFFRELRLILQTLSRVLFSEKLTV